MIIKNIELQEMDIDLFFNIRYRRIRIFKKICCNFKRFTRNSRIIYLYRWNRFSWIKTTVNWIIVTRR